MDHILPSRRVMLALTAAALLPAASAWAAAASAVPTDAEILAVQAKFIDAIQNAPAEQIAPMLSEKLTYLHASGGKNDKAKQLAMFTGQKTPRWIKVENKDLTVKAYPGVAVVTGDLYFTSAPRPGSTEAPKANPYRHTTVWAKEDGVWRLVNWQINNIVQRPAG
jgi:ketosteroid isomerase-like protein